MIRSTTMAFNSRSRTSRARRTGGVLAPELMARVQQVHLRTHRLVNTALAGSYRSTFRGTGVEFEEVRPYIPGDDVRLIDWNVTARTREPYVKLFREERELTVHLLVDTALTLDFGTTSWTKREAAAQLTGLISMVALRNQDRVGLSLFGREVELHLPAGKGSHHTLRIIREVMNAAVCPVQSDLFGALQAAERTLRRRSLVFLVSDFLSAPPDGEWIKVLARLEHRHDVIAVRVIDPLEEALPSAGLVQLLPLGGDRSTEVDTRSSAVRDAWSTAAQARRTDIARGLARARVDRFDLAVEQDLAEPLVSFFRRRERARRGL